MSDLHARGARIFGGSAWEVHWPYGLHDPQWRLKQTSPELWQQELAEQPLKQLAIVEWAERYGLKESRSGCCPQWLRRAASRRCQLSDCAYSARDNHWLDHPIGWIKDGRPFAITSAPYSFDDRDKERLTWWATTDPRLATATGAGWYGNGTTQVVIWRGDRIETVEPAEPETGATQ